MRHRISLIAGAVSLTLLSSSAAGAEPVADGAGPEEVLDAGTAALERNKEEGVPFDEIAGEDRAAVDEMIELLNDPTQRESSAGMDPAGSGLGIMTPRQCYLRTGWAAESSGGVTLSRIRMQIRTCFGTGGVPQNHVNRSDSDVFPPVVDHIHPASGATG